MQNNNGNIPIRVFVSCATVAFESFSVAFKNLSLVRLYVTSFDSLQLDSFVDNVTSSLRRPQQLKVNSKS